MCVVWWVSTDRIMNVGQRGLQLLGLPSDFGRVMSASDSFSVPPSPICSRIYRFTVLITKHYCFLPRTDHGVRFILSVYPHRLITDRMRITAMIQVRCSLQVTISNILWSKIAWIDIIQ